MFKDLLALTKPRLNFLVLLSALAGNEMGRSGAFEPWRFFEFAAALFTLAGASSALNMWMERGPDALMARTAKRPMASGRMKPTAGLVFGLALSVVSIAWLGMRVNALCAWLGVATWVSYLLIYTPLKRVTSMATLVGAIPGALPPVMGWAAATGSLGPQALALFAILFLWQIPHFLAIAVMYGDEYKSAGFKVMPIEQGREGTGRQMALYSLAMLPAGLAVYRLGMSGKVYAFASIALGLGYTLAALYAARVPQRRSARSLLLVSVMYLPLLLTFMLADKN
ncbi:MAG: heme o synthase [candidate division FCPU426 bacterium]